MFSNLKVGNFLASWAARLSELVPITLKVIRISLIQLLFILVLVLWKSCAGADEQE